MKSYGIMRRILPVVPAMAACTTVSRAQGKTAEIVGAADRFLATLSAEQRQKVLYGFEDETQRAKWSNFRLELTR